MEFKDNFHDLPIAADLRQSPAPPPDGSHLVLIRQQEGPPPSEGPRGEAPQIPVNNNNPDVPKHLHHLTRHWIAPDNRGERAISRLGAADMKAAEHMVR